MRQLLILFFYTIALQAQVTISGKIIDSESEEPMSFVNIYDKTTNQGVYTNDEGFFKFEGLNSNTKQVIISSMGYKTIEKPLSDFTKNETLTIALEPESYIMEEVVLVNKSLRDIVKNLVESSKERLDRSIKLEAYYREFVKVNGQYSKFADGLIDYYLKPKRKDKVKAMAIVNQSRAFQLIASEDIQSNGKMDLSEVGSLYDYRNVTGGFFNFGFIEKKLTDKKTAEEYDFQIKTLKNNEGRNLEKLFLIPKSSVEELLIEGYILYDADKKIIIEYDLKLSEEHKQYSEMINLLIAKAKIFDFETKVSFKYNNEEYEPNYIKNEFDFYIKFGKQIQDRFAGTQDLIVNHYNPNISENQYPSKDEVSKSSSLYDNGTNYTTEYWLTNKAIPLSEEKEQILKQLQNENN